MSAERPGSPTVTAVMPVADGERFIAEALESALGQDYPAACLDVVVVDDGSQDRTVEIVEGYVARHPGRIRLLRQARGGQVAAVNAGLAVARGELLALLDADDVWPADKTRRQVDVLLARPEVALVYGDMCVIDAAGGVIQESWLEGDDPPSGHCPGRLLTGNPAMSSSLVLRRELADGGIPAMAPWPDWWLAVRAAETAEIAYLPEPRTLYRFHGANLSLGAEGARLRGELERSIGFLRALIRHMAPEIATAGELATGWDHFEIFAGRALELSHSPFVALVDVGDEERAEAAALGAAGEQALAAGRPEGALRAFVAAAAADPWDESLREGLREAREALRLGAHGAAAAG